MLKECPAPFSKIMNNCNKYISAALVFLLALTVPLHSQTRHEHLLLGRTAFDDHDFYTAVYHLNKAVSSDTDDVTLIEMYADALRLTHAYSDAERWYKKLINHSHVIQAHPEILFNLASVKQRSAKYAAAYDVYKQFYETLENTSDFIALKTKQRMASCLYAEKLLRDTNDVRIRALEQTINSEYAEFNPYVVGDTLLYFSALRPYAQHSSSALINPTYNTKIYASNLSISGWSEAEAIQRSINTNRYHNANICFNPEKTVMYFSRCRELKPGQLQCDLYKSRLGNRGWRRPEKLPEPVNLDGYTTTQPTYGRVDGLHDVIFFVSDRPGGQGGYDIWYTIINDGAYQEPINLGSFINTPGNEITPFFHKPSQTLYFSSDWHEGMGGYDIFKSTGYYNSWTKPENLGFPVNSSFNDTYYVKSELHEEAFMASNRPGPMTLKGNACCNNIYYLEYETRPIIEIPDEIIVEIVEDTIITEVEKEVRKLLPLALYFHNDMPDPATLLTRSKSTYTETFKDYLAMTDTYIAKYSEGLEGQAKIQAERDIKDFFSNYVVYGYEQLERFTSWLIKDLEAGRQVHIVINGYASPLNTSEYNIRLSKRRISTLINFFERYDNGRIKPFLDGTAAQGRLIIHEEPLGDSQANPLVSNNPHDHRNSIYSRFAALERKVEIVQYVSGDEDTEIEFAEINFGNTSHNFGVVEPGQRLTHNFTFRNTGDVPLVISNVETTSAQLVTQWQTEEILPGRRGIINVLFNVEGAEGNFMEFIYVTGNTKSGRTTLKIEAVIDEP